uniref:MFS domain-containing protein n=1 Tax=Panagrellus redivivus TaxID=6233 RepID=A0A7E5A199_PANRE
MEVASPESSVEPLDDEVEGEKVYLSDADVKPNVEFEDDPPTDWRSIYVANIVAGLATLQSGTGMSTVWPYMKIVNPNMTETVYGIIQGASALGNIIAAGITGVWANKWRNTKPPLITGKVISIIAACIYLIIQLKTSAALILFLLFDIFNGIASGFSSAYRTHISMASKENERSKAFGLSMFASSLGLILGPLLQMLFTLLGYPGASLFLGFNLNLYTAPFYLAILLSIVAVILLIFFFNGTMRITQKKIAIPTTENTAELDDIKRISVVITEDVFKHDSSEKPISTIQKLSKKVKEILQIRRRSRKVKPVKTVKYDKIAVFVLMATKITLELNMLAITSLMAPYSMAAFQWSSSDTVKYTSAMMLAVGGFSMIFSVAYVFFKINKIISERIALVCSMIVFLLFFVLTFPWPFLGKTMPYQHVKGEAAYFNQTEAIAVLASSNSTSAELVGCNVKYAWCAKTPRVNVYVFTITAVIAIGIAMPFSNVNLDILYSKMLGPIKQGVLQALFVSIEQVLNVVGPVIFSLIYTLSGPTYLWIFEIVASCIGIALLLLNFRRMISFTNRVERKVLKHGTIVS